MVNKTDTQCECGKMLVPRTARTDLMTVTVTSNYVVRSHKCGGRAQKEWYLIVDYQQCYKIRLCHSLDKPPILLRNREPAEQKNYNINKIDACDPQMLLSFCVTAEKCCFPQV